ncbi:ABC transporter C family member 8-like isoform X1 [Silene latifolia]|uniref:ABC transporter C family member 8-like isoform X1 n=2 Tax=Silene latifolia TaxID=37657 RepID=UPI003D77688A
MSEFLHQSLPQTSMASFTNLLRGYLIGVDDGGEFELGSSSFHRNLIHAINLCFIIIFYLLVLLSLSSRGQSRPYCRKDRMSIAVSICSALVSLSYFVVGLLVILPSEEYPAFGWQLYVFRGVVWLSLAISLLSQKSKWMKLFTCTWWMSVFVLITIINIELLAKQEEVEILDFVRWPVSALLFICSIKLLCQKEPIDFDDLSKSFLPENPKTAKCEQAKPSLLSRLTFSWLNPLISLGYSKPLSLNDIPCLFSEDEANLAYTKFSETWDALKTEESFVNEQNMVIKVLLKDNLKDIISVGVLAFLKTITVVASPLLLYAFVNYSNASEQKLSQGLTLLGILVIVKVAESLTQRQWTYYAKRSGLRIRSALMVAVYNKLLKLSCTARKMHSTGEIVNYIMVDAYRTGELAWWFHLAWSLPLQLLIAIGVLIGVVGLGAVPALIPLFICGLLNTPFAKRLQECRAKSMDAQDKRLRSTSEILNSMKIIKLQSWEDHFLELIYSLRDSEFKWLTDTQHNIANCTALYWFSPIVISTFAFWGCTYLSSVPLDAVTLFTILATLSVVAEPVVMLPNVFSYMIQVMVSFNRINKVLISDEVKIDLIGRTELVNKENSVEITASNFSWDSESGILTLTNIDLEVKQKDKVAVCGPVGSGKSSLLYAILGEIPKISGNVGVFGSIAYVSQSAWIQSGTIRDNICYGKPMDKDRYENAIKACALDKDIKNFSHGDRTEIGQRGINLSGGQKQRIQLARAVYSDADIYLLDDPFSAVDAHTAATLFNDCVLGALENKTVILVTHQVEFLPQVDKILVMNKGQVTQSGSYEDLLEAGKTFEQLVNAHAKAVTQMDNSRAEVEESEGPTLIQQIMISESFHGSMEDLEKDMPMHLTQDEEKEVGDVGIKPYLDYLSVSKGTAVFSWSLISQCAFVAFQALSRYWLAFAIGIPMISSGTLIGVYAGLSILGLVAVHIRALLTVNLGLKASKAFFEGFMNSIFRAPMLFFDSTPVGRILTRASSDLCILDLEIPYALSHFLAGGIELVGIVVVMAVVTWQVLIVGVFNFLIAHYFQKRYIASAREILRINGTTKGPIMNYAAETSQGVITIRAFRKMDQFFYKYLTVVDTDAKLFFYSNTAMEWLLLRIEALENITLFAFAFLLILLPNGYVPPGYVGLSLSYALSLKATHVFMVQWYCNIMNYIISVERIKQFMHIEPECQATFDGMIPLSNWPSRGKIELQDLMVKYQPGAPLVLKGITCTFNEGTKVGVVGRTGSGKTTLISALFRLVEPYSGTICIDDIDICSIGLKNLRSKLSVIPQEPTLFQGTIRSNLDPLGLYSDADIWEALEKCQLKLTISNLPNQLDSSVGDEGANWSMGQRQLFCLGRVLLKRNKILILDEATASIDSATDAILQKIIRVEFAECTVITVAHRIPTVIDSDMVMVLSYGELIEYDEPTKLMHCNSSFSKLVTEYWSSYNGGASSMRRSATF